MHFLGLDLHKYSIFPAKVLRYSASTLALSAAAAFPAWAQEASNSSNQNSAVYVAQAVTGSPAPIAGSVTQSPITPETVVVTAEKREERLLDVPAPVTVVQPEALTAMNLNNIQDFASTVPGFVDTPGSSANQVTSIRGITTGNIAGGATVGFLVDGVPYGASSSAFSSFVPNIDPGDLERIEVLKGPQGALYGANSMGGLVNYITKLPSLTDFSGRVETETDTVSHGAEPGYSLRGSANIPVTDTFGLRVSGVSRRDAGYIDNPTTGRNDINDAQTYGARAVALWKPIADLSVVVSALYQKQTANAVNDAIVGSNLGDLQTNFIAGLAPLKHITEAYSADIKYDFQGIRIESIAGYNQDINDFSYDLSALFGQGLQSTFGVGGADTIDPNTTKKYTEELRVSSSIGPIDWFLGGFYTHEHTDFGEDTFAVDPLTGARHGQYYHLFDTQTYDEKAVFANATYHFSDQFNIELGGRYSDLQQVALPGVLEGALVGGGVVPIGNTRSSADVFTFLVTPQYKISTDVMAYIRIASGYRPGGANTIASGVPSQYGPDRTTNYEAGFKGSFLDGDLVLDASVYYIDWKNIQVSQRNALGEGYTGNGSGAKSEGVEFSFDAKPMPGFTLSGWISYDDAVLTQSFGNSPLYGVPGLKLPFNGPFSAYLAARKEFSLTDSLTAFVGGDVNYIDSRLGPFQSTAVRQEFPAYTKFNLQAGFETGSWQVSVFATNVTDKRGELDGGLGYINQNAFIYIQPRTVGLNLVKNF